MSETALLCLLSAALLLPCHVVGAQQEEDVQGGLANRNLLVVAEEWSPYWTISETPDAANGSYEYGGILYELLLFMQQARNFTFDVMRPPDGSWGDGGCTSPNETVGMMGMVARKEVDLAIGCCKDLYSLEICILCDKITFYQGPSFKIPVVQDLRISPRQFTWTTTPSLCH